MSVRSWFEGGSILIGMSATAYVLNRDARGPQWETHLNAGLAFLCIGAAVVLGRWLIQRAPRYRIRIERVRKESAR